MAEHWPTWDELRAQDKAAGRIDEAKVAAHRLRMLDAQRAYRLAEIRKSLGLTQTDLAAAMHVSQRRVSAVEHGDLARTNLGTVATYVTALGGRIEIVASFGDERIVIGLPIPAKPGHPLAGASAYPSADRCLGLQFAALFSVQPAPSLSLPAGNPVNASSGRGEDTPAPSPAD